MKLSPLFLGLALAAVGACSSTPRSKHSVSEWGDHPMENPEFMNAMTAAMTPGEAHAELARRAGSWNIRTLVFMSPGAEAVEMDATADSEMILGGRFLLEEFHGSMMGEPFEGLLIVGYDNLAEEYFSLWMDTWGTAVHKASGPRAKDGTIRLKGSMRDVISPEGRPYRHVLREQGSGFAVELFDTSPDGAEWQVMQMTYTRRPTE